MFEALNFGALDDTLPAVWERSAELAIRRRDGPEPSPRPAESGQTSTFAGFQAPFQEGLALRNRLR